MSKSRGFAFGDIARYAKILTYPKAVQIIAAERTEIFIAMVAARLVGVCPSKETLVSALREAGLN